MKISISSGDPLIGSNRDLAVNWFFFVWGLFGAGELTFAFYLRVWQK